MVSGRSNYLLTLLQFFGLVFIVLELRYVMTGNIISPTHQIQMQWEHCPYSAAGKAAALKTKATKATK
jgi:hypothetical protein